MGIELYEVAVSACAVHNLRRAARIVTSLFDDALAPSRLKATQLDVLITVWRSEGMTLSRIAQLLAMDRTTLARNLDVLRRRGLITITPGVDRRARRIGLTAEGRIALEAALPLWERAQTSVVTALGGSRWAGLLADLDVMTGRSRRSTVRTPASS
jgi:DNA-binding MarR family transcriptional regulator